MAQLADRVRLDPFLIPSPMFTRFLARACVLVLAVSTFTGAVAAQQSAPTASHLAAARELLVLMQTDRTMQASAETMIDLQIAQLPELAEVPK